MDDFSDLTAPQPAAWGDRPRHVLLQGVVGSHAYGLDTPTSDTDRRGVFLAPSMEFFGLDEPALTADNPYADEVLYELGRFAQLALRGNPVILELLYLPEYEIRTPLGDELIEMRWAFLGADRIRAAWLGAARGMLGDVRKGGGRTAKSARHLCRLLQTGIRFWQTGLLQPQLEQPDQVRAFGDRVAGGDIVAAAALLEDYERRFAQTPTVLPPAADRARVDAWLKRVRRRALDVQAA